MEDGDDELIARVARGDSAAFSRLVSRYRARLTGTTTRIVGNRAIAEEIVQEVFTRAWVNAPKWRPQEKGRSSFAGWLGRVATNLAIDHTRRTRTVPLDDAPEPVDATIAADDELIAAEDRRKLEAALAQLPPRQRAAIALTYDQGLSNAEGAAAMDISVGAFELLLVRARRALRQAMMEDRAR
ncbi:MAG TPA: sigma-70 family RNA polymerase sigma factor [Rhizomicrobium sp.]|nr:sigma-70 family RNA polymerase sigma factor [Rhizomicrobium sp.]